jgi:hypothetical protein
VGQPAAQRAHQQGGRHGQVLDSRHGTSPVVRGAAKSTGDLASPGVAILSLFTPDLMYVTGNLEETRLPGSSGISQDRRPRT